MKGNLGQQLVSHKLNSVLFLISAFSKAECSTSSYATSLGDIGDHQTELICTLCQFTQTDSIVDAEGYLSHHIIAFSLR